MRYDFVYENNNGEKINLSKLPYKINIEPLIDYSWSYKTKQRQLGNKIVGFFKDIKDSTATLHVLAATAKERDEAIDYFNNVIEKDIYYGTAGKLWLGDWYTYAFITASKNSKWQYDAGIVKKEITISKEADSWYHITRSANYGEQEESTVYIAEDYIKTYESSGVDSGIKSLIANIVPQQSGSGTPSPDNVREISGWESVETVVSGKNLFDKDNITDVNAYFGTKLLPSTNHKTVYVPCKPNTTYTVSNSANNRRTLGYTKELPAVNVDVYGTATGAITTGADAQYLVCYCYNQNTDTVTYQDVINAIQLELGTTATAYEPYTGTTHTTSLGRIVYGGTVDVVSGTLTDKMKLIDLGSLSWSYQSTWESWYTDYIADVKGTNTGMETPNFVSDRFETIPTNAGFSPQAQGFTGITSTTRGSSGCRILVKNGSTTEAPTGQLCYELATPTTYTLTPSTINTLSGVNNVWADSGDVTVTFRDDHGDIQTESGSIVTFEKKNALSGSGYDYAYDYMHDAQSQKIIANAGSIPCDFIITIQGYADSPIITIGDNTYAVNVEVPYGANLVIDSTQKTVIITLADGTKINAFGARDPDYYLFERIESGKNAVTWDGSYLWELLMIEERSEPRWLTD